ncbi:hypothetical protein K443DRAFT_106289 [Laccaria amethystina LaAM-08-1]|uniref:Unplaced genomic scaffold K443scaffold_170, whole genome shotgun sequence n=1 Tax=Laccaria amethystina LaAM-08-1 TaxID=1095629 RepID=A0A0C9WL51_9AGAR|nr:hypothetical protein K443DRAFT_106289 [Laccaria amethystina LaAM-08-1]
MPAITGAYLLYVIFHFRLFALMFSNFSVSYCGSFRMSVGSFRYLHAPLTCSTKPFTKRLCSCPVSYCGPFCMSVGSFGYLHDPLTRST